MPATTPRYGFQYAVGGDAPDLAYISQSLAETIENAFNGSWTSLAASLLAGFTGTLRYQITGPFVVLHGDITGTFVGGYTQFATSAIPATPGMRPSVDWFGSAWLQGHYAGNCVVTASGNLAIAQATGASRPRAQFSIIYPIGA